MLLSLRARALMCVRQRPRAFLGVQGPVDEDSDEPGAEQSLRRGPLQGHGLSARHGGVGRYGDVGAGGGGVQSHAVRSKRRPHGVGAHPHLRGPQQVGSAGAFLPHRYSNKRKAIFLDIHIGFRIKKSLYFRVAYSDVVST